MHELTYLTLSAIHLYMNAACLHQVLLSGKLKAKRCRRSVCSDCFMQFSNLLVSCKLLGSVLTHTHGGHSPNDSEVHYFRDDGLSQQRSRDQQMLMVPVCLKRLPAATSPTASSQRWVPVMHQRVYLRALFLQPNESLLATLVTLLQLPLAASTAPDSCPICPSHPGRSAH